MSSPTSPTTSPAATPKIHGGDPRQGWGDCSTDTLWTYEELSALVAALKAEGLELAALENFSPRFWYDVLLGGPERPAQIEGLKRLIRDAGRAGVPCIGYNFSIAGVYGWTRGPLRPRPRQFRRPRHGAVGTGRAHPRRHGLEHAVPRRTPRCAFRQPYRSRALGSASSISSPNWSRLPKRLASPLPPTRTIRRWT